MVGCIFFVQVVRSVSGDFPPGMLQGGPPGGLLRRFPCGTPLGDLPGGSLQGIPPRDLPRRIPLGDALGDPPGDSPRQSPLDPPRDPPGGSSWERWGSRFLKAIPPKGSTGGFHPRGIPPLGDPARRSSRGIRWGFPRMSPRRATGGGLPGLPQAAN